MRVYLDSSVVLRLVLGQPDRLREWPSVTGAVASALVEMECLRTLDRLRLDRQLDESALVERREAVYRLLAATEIVELSMPLLRQASQPLPTALGTLDAIHLATALLWRDYRNEALVFATHDRALARAARSMGLETVGDVVEDAG